MTFLTVYIMEAHAEDTWPLGLEQSYNQTYTLAARAQVARDFISQNNYHYTLRLDEAPSNTFNTVFAAWPLRFFVIEPDGRLAYIHEPEGAVVSVKSFQKWLALYFE